MTDVRKTFDKPLKKEKLFEWHIMLMGRNECKKVHQYCQDFQSHGYKGFAGPDGNRRLQTCRKGRRTQHQLSVDPLV